MSMEDRRNIIATIRNDVNYLESQGLMDYSLLLAIEVIGGVKKQLTINEKNQNLADEKEQGMALMKFTEEDEKLYCKIFGQELNSYQFGQSS